MANTALTVPGNNREVIFNDNGSLGANGYFTFNTGTSTLSVKNLNVGPGIINATNYITTGGDIIPYGLGQNLGRIDKRWYNLYLDGGIYAGGTFGNPGQVLVSDGFGTITWSDAVNTANIANNLALTYDTNTRNLAAYGANTANSALLYARLAYQAANSATGYALAQSAYDQANLAFEAANTSAGPSSNLAQAAFNTANSATSNTIYTQGVDAGQNTLITAATLSAVSAFNTANSGLTIAQAAYNASNTVSSTLSNNITYVQGVNDTQNTNINTANSLAGFARTLAQAAYASANGATLLAQAAYNKANADGTLAQAAFDTANSATSNTIYTQGVDASQNSSINTISLLAQAAFEQANTTTNYVLKAGDTITGIINIANTSDSYAVNSGALRISGGLGVTGNLWGSSIYANNYYGTVDAGDF